MRNIILIGLIGGMLFSGTELTTMHIDEQLKRAEVLEVDIEFGLGEISISPGDGKAAVSGTVEYNDRLCDVEYSYHESGSKGIFALEVDWDSRKKHDNDKDDDELGCNLEISKNTPVDLSIELGLGEGILNLNKMKIHSVDVECGLGKARIDFGRNGNRTGCEYIDVETGLGSVDILNLSNANSDRMDFSCGLGSMDLDFSGDLNDDIYVDVAVGMGSADILIPVGTNVIFEYDYNLFSDVDLHDFENSGNDEYRSENFREGKPTIFISASVGMGSIDVKWID